MMTPLFRPNGYIVVFLLEASRAMPSRRGRCLSLAYVTIRPGVVAEAVAGSN